jgi:hypothetical protein
MLSITRILACFADKTQKECKIRETEAITGDLAAAWQENSAMLRCHAEVGTCAD